MDNNSGFVDDVIFNTDISQRGSALSVSKIYLHIYMELKLTIAWDVNLKCIITLFDSFLAKGYETVYTTFMSVP